MGFYLFLGKALTLSRLSGGDLDGDGGFDDWIAIRKNLLPDYTLIWDHNYWPKRQVPAMDSTPPEPRRVDKVTINDVKEVSW